MNEPCRRRAIYAARNIEAAAKPLMDELISPPEMKAEDVFGTVKTSPPGDKHACPKCGKIVRQGKYLHQKFCKGK